MGGKKKVITTNYQTTQVERRSITQALTGSGTLQPAASYTVTTLVTGEILNSPIKEGDKVKEGDVLIKTSTGDEIKAKIDGEVSNVNVEENATVMAGVKLLDIVDYDNLQITVKVDEYDVASITKGKETTVKIGALDKEIKGTVSSVSKEGQTVNGVTFFTANIDLAKDSSLKVGMSAEAKLVSDSVKGVVTLPMKAIQFDDDNQPYVFTKGEKDLPAKTSITTGINDGTTVEVKSGVKNGETVLYTSTATKTGGMGFMRNNGSASSVSGGGN
jgi:HlyD family secretion protein